MTRFVTRMVRREIRTGRRHFLFILFAIALGVGSIVGVGNIASNLDTMTSREARSLLTADLEARLNHPLSKEGEKALTDLNRQGVGFVRVTELISMAAREDSSSSQLVELKAVEPGYPFYGRLQLDPPVPDPFRDPDSIWVQEGLLIRLQLHVGDRLRLGEVLFTIRGIVRKEPDRVVGTFSLGPRILLSQDALKKTGLIQIGSRVNYRLLIKASDSRLPEALKDELKQRWAGEPVRVQTYREAQPRLGRFLENLTTYLGLVGLITLMIGGIIVANNIHALLKERIETIAILKSLGGTSRTILWIYLFLALFLGGVGSLAGVALGIGTEQVLRHLLADFLPPDLSFQITLPPMVRGVAMGLLTTLLFSLWPLWIIRRIPASRIFRRDVEPERGRFSDRSGIILAVVIFLGWIGLAIWQAGSWRLGGWVVAAVAASVLLLSAALWGLLRLLKPISRPRRLILRYGISNLYRPGRAVGTIVLSIGIGVVILLTLALVERRLMDQLQDNIPADAPGLFFIDLQPDQKKPFETMMAKWSLKAPPELTPVVRSRLYSLNGKKVSEMQAENRPDGWYFTREYVLTYQKDLPKHNVLREGKWWPEVYDGDSPEKHPLISAEAEAARHLGIGIGDTVTFDIQGVLQSAEVASIREVDWNSLTTNFFFIFEPGVLETAPVTYVATVITRPEDDLPIQNDVIRAFPNVTVILLREVLETVVRILKEISRTVRFMAVLGLIVGMIVLSSAITATRARRIHEMVLFKTLGATRPTLIAIMAVEYALLGLIAAVVGGILSVGVSWGIVRFFLDVPWRFDPMPLLIGLIATVSLTLITGFLTSWRILGEKPLRVLRAE